MQENAMWRLNVLGVVGEQIYIYLRACEKS